MKSPWKKWLTAIVILFALAVAAIWVSCVEPCRFPTNEEVLARWQKDRETILSLQKLLDQQPGDIVGIGPQGVMKGEPYNQVSPQRAGMSSEVFADARRKMAACQIASFVRSEKQMYFSFAACGFAGSGWRMNFVYRTIKPLGVMQSLDDFRQASLKDSSTAYVALEKNWYVNVIW